MAEDSNALYLAPADLSKVHVLVIGDVMLDRYWAGPAHRVSPEAPVPVVKVETSEGRPGGAANVALNVVSLGARCTLVGYVGDDEPGQSLTETLEAAGVQCDFVIVEDWPTIVKLRLLSQQQQLIRADFEEPVPAVGMSERLAVLQNKAEKYLSDCDVLVLEDYDKGVLDEPAALLAAATKAGVQSVVDPKMKPLATYRGASIIKPNEKEFLHNVGADVSGEELAQEAVRLCTDLGFEGVVVTRGGDGMEVCGAAESRHIPARPVEVYDVTGAGDTTIAGLAIGVALDWTLFDAAQVANVAASIAVSKSGTSPVTGPEVNRALSQRRRSQGVMDRDELAREVDISRQAGERIVFTNGCFDLLHAGHVTYLEEAAALGDRLIVAINDDASVTKLKGKGRPVVPVEGRSRVLLGLGCVDWVVSFSEDTPIPLLELLQPEILVKGGDYGPDQVVGADIVKNYGGQVQVLSLVEEVSTSAIVERIAEGIQTDAT
ncbi:MAG: bifunctional D-glycero-beta-D-manno-heptose-7-phosphate kinase/D-glycero-beta-D-manno-heptose 1-phosphate adenylyltransferase HldE [Pseudomonadales bacterium]|nr:bifunctional D-glycero-beta-D-manno-heptose-7-phosphate kinase/D-glycero-beta-D-manno-heptose 1-phosphate adenylyltransferase HldE [Pseudomonadales bacterium]